MQIFRRIPLPRHLDARLWFLSVPLSLLSLERRQRLPKLPLGRWRFLGIPPMLGGAALILWARTILTIQGEGTPDPDNPPRNLVEQGPYRYTRNPMNLGGFLFLAGLGLLMRSLLLFLYVPALATFVHLHLVREEEPELRQRFGEQYEAYRRRVPRWLPLPWRRPRQQV